MSVHHDKRSQMKQLLDEQLERLESNPEIKQRLQQAREHALEKHHEASFLQRNKPLISWAMAATVLLAIWLPVWFYDKNKDEAVMFDINIAEIELLTEFEDLEQDIEFYYWLEEMNEHSG